MTQLINQRWMVRRCAAVALWERTCTAQFDARIVPYTLCIDKQVDLSSHVASHREVAPVHQFM